MDLEDLQTFVEIAAEGGVSAAARRMGILMHEALLQGPETWRLLDGDKVISLHPRGHFKADSGAALIAAATAGLIDLTPVEALTLPWANPATRAPWDQAVSAALADMAQAMECGGAEGSASGIDQMMGRTQAASAPSLLRSFEINHLRAGQPVWDPEAK